MTPRRPRRIWPWLFGLFLAGWLATAIATLPLAAVIQAVDLPDDLALESSHGTIWNGRMTIRWDDRPPVDLRLDWNPAALLRLAAEWRVDARSAGMTAEGRLHLPVTRLPGRHIELTEATLQADMDSPWIDDHPTTLPMTGHMRLTIADWRFVPQLDSGRWQLDWSRAGFRVNGEVPFGRIEGEGRIAAGRIAGTVRSSDGNPASLPRLDMRIRQGDDKRIVLEGEIDAREDRNLQDALTVIGRRTANGTISIRHEITIP